jgi:hypothetical protein
LSYEVRKVVTQEGAHWGNRNQPLYHYSAYSEPAEPEPVSETAARGGMLCQNTIS